MNTIDDVKIGDSVASGVNYDTSAHPVDSAVFRFIRGIRDVFLAMDINDAVSARLDGPYNCSPSEIFRRGNAMTCCKSKNGR
jgi:hypothetical protein